MENTSKDGTAEISSEVGITEFCPVCGEATQKKLPFPLMDGTGRVKQLNVHIMCSCEKKKQEDYERELKKEEEMKAIQILRNLSLMDSKLSKASLSSFAETEDNGKLLRIIKNYIDGFDRMYKENQGLILWGPVGTGKSYSAAVIANELINRKVPVIMTSFIKMLNKLVAFEDVSEEIERLNQAKLLIIDDLGAERGTDYALEKVYDIIDNRYRSNKPIILTTNLTIEQMKNCDDIRYTRIYDRIFEMCYPVKVTGLSWRKREAAMRYSATKQLLEEA